MSEGNLGRSFRVLWADDVREADGGKLSLSGIYSSILEIDKGETVPKVYAFAEVTSPVDRPFERIRFVAEANGQVLLDFLLPAGSLQGMHDQIAAIKSRGSEPGLEPRFALRAGLPITGLVINEPTVLKLSIETEEGTMHGEPLLLRPR